MRHALPGLALVAGAACADELRVLRDSRRRRQSPRFGEREGVWPLAPSMI
jgi:hypothetical protein